jgi:sigma-B regulation protein RsbU (phosphoserine phosphatase)
MCATPVKSETTQKPPAESLFLLPEDLPNLVLVAEDDANARKLLCLCLKTASYDVLEAKDGNEAVALARQHRPPVLLCDWRMPGMNGLEVCEELRNDPAVDPLYIIMLTSRRSRADVVAALDAGADDYLAKPWDPQELLARIRAGQRMVNLQSSLAARNDDFQRLSQRLTREMETISNIQKALLPQEVPQTDAFDFTAFYMPSTECGGDYYDLIELDGRRYGFVVADVSGHGAPAMVTMALVRQNFHIIANQFEAPHQLLEELNRLLFDHVPTEQYATMLYAILNTETLECTYSSAGHTPPYWFHRARGEATKLENCEGYPLKLVTRDATYESTTIRLEPGDKLVFYTDGIPECFNPRRQLYGAERLERFIHDHAGALSPVEMETQLITDVLQFADSHPAQDDLTLAILEVK